MRQLRELVRAREIDAVVVGLPLSLSGADTEQTRAARSFAAALSRTIDIPVELYDERFTTRLAQRMHTDPKAPEDSRAAALLLESWIAAQSR
jgi:putative Holliday junction resolvase